MGQKERNITVLRTRAVALGRSTHAQLDTSLLLDVRYSFSRYSFLHTNYCEVQAVYNKAAKT